MKGKSYKLKRMQTWDETHKGKGKLAILAGMDPSKAVPMALVMQKEFQNNDPDAAKLFFAPPSGWVEE